jgi:hypothetical protein
MVAKTIEVGKFYYYGKVKRKMKCTAVGTCIDKSQSDFVDYLNNKYRFYNHDMHINRFKVK